MSGARDYAAIARRYATAVVAGREPACQWVRLACRRHLDDLRRERDRRFAYRFDRGRAAKVCRFVELLPHIKGPKAGQPLVLEPWQVFVVAVVFGWLVKATGRRRFRRAYIEVPRGNGKSALTSPIGLYLLAADGESGAEVYSAATTRDQARIVFQMAREMVRRSPDLRDALGVQVHAQAITVLSEASKFEALSADAHTLDGLNVHGGLIDELHAHRTREVYDVIETGCGKREQPLLWVITTAGSNQRGICYEVRSYVQKVLAGTVQDDAQFGVIYTIDEGDDWREEAIWRKANPNWGVSVQPDHVAQLAAKAMQLPSATANFLTKHLDVWVNADLQWLPPGAWAACADRGLSAEQFAGAPCVIGLDLASKTDVAAALRLFRDDWVGDDQPSYTVFARFYLPEARIEQDGTGMYRGWRDSGWLVETPGDVIDFTTIEEHLLDDSRLHEVREIAYDPWQATQLAQRLQAQGALAVEFRNTVGNFSPAMKELEALTRARRIRHDGNPVLEWMFSNVVCHYDAKENVYPRKERPENKIDGVVALITALGRWMAQPAPARSVYEERGFFEV